MSEDNPALPEGWVKKTASEIAKDLQQQQAAGSPSSSSSSSTSSPSTPISPGGAFCHVSGGWMVTTIALHFPGRFPPYYNFSSKSWVAIAPSDDGTNKKALILNGANPLNSIPPQITKAIQLAIEKKKNAIPVAIKLPVKLDKPLPKLPQGWSEIFRDGDYVKFQHRHTQRVCSELWCEELEAGFAPTYFSYATSKRTTVRPTESNKLMIVGAPPPPPPDLPPPRLPNGWIKKYESSDDDVPYFQEWKTGKEVQRLYVEEPGIGPNKTACYYDYAGEERFTLPPDLGQYDLIVDLKGKEVEVVKPEEVSYGGEIEGEDLSASSKKKVTAVVASGTVAAARSSFGNAGGLSKQSHILSPSSSSSSSSSSLSSAKKAAAAHTTSTSVIGAGAESEASEEQLSSPISPSAGMMPTGWTKYSDEEGDTYFMDAGGNALWVLWLEYSDGYGSSSWYNLGTGDVVTERPDVGDDDAACAIVNQAGERVFTYSSGENAVGEEEAQADETTTTTTTTTTSSSSGSDLPVGWTLVRDGEDVYYYNESTGEAVWEKPTA